MKKRNDRLFLAVTIPLIAVLFAAIATYFYLLPDLRYRWAVDAYEAGDDARAMALLEHESSSRTDALMQQIYLRQTQQAFLRGDWDAVDRWMPLLPDTEEKRAIQTELDYMAAVALFDAGDWESAVEAFRNLNGYRDSFSYVDRARQSIAEQLYASGDGAGAVELLLSLGGTDNEARAAAIAMEVTGLTDPEEALRTIRGLDPETVAKLKRMRSLQTELQNAQIAVGFFHTVGILENGCATATGDNTYGQCDVADWADLVAIAAGAYHTVGLKRDGTVVATGENTYGQCDVSAWQNVCRIAANNYDTIALTNDGRILSTGFHDYSAAADWPNDLCAIAAGGYGVCAVRRDGTLLTCFQSDRATEFSELTYAAVQIGYAIGLKADGTILTHGITLPEWTEIVGISAGSNRVLAWNVAGEVFEFPFAERDRMIDSTMRDVYAAANGATHCAFLKSDGTVLCVGDNTCGQCETGGWKLRVSPDEQ